MKPSHILIAILGILPPALTFADPPESVNLRKTVIVQVVAKTKAAVVNISTTPVNRLRDLIPELMDPAQLNNLDIHCTLKERRTISQPATARTEIVTEDGSQVIRDNRVASGALIFGTDPDAN